MALVLAAAHASRPRVGELANGDLALVRRAGPHVLLAVIDALGHGPEAERVAERARAHLASVDLASCSIDALFAGLHGALSGSRGAAATACIFDGARLRGGGVGNVTLRAYGTSVPALLTPGIVGGPHRARVREFVATLVEGDRFAIFSDGLSASFGWDASPGAMASLDLEQAAAALLERAARPHDDATLLLAHVRPG